jgi:23S rRNA-/tRNA-specific pseudouridylate synthase
VSIPIAEEDVGGWHMVCVHEKGDPPVVLTSTILSRPATTEVTALAYGTLHGQPVTKVLLQPRDGRRHQLRLHMEAIGHSIVGDMSYGGEKELKARRMCLHAWQLTLHLPWVVSGALARRAHKAVHAWARKKEQQDGPLAPLSVSAPDPFHPGYPGMDDLALTPVTTSVEA